jgi:hypothetical protein
MILILTCKILKTDKNQNQNQRRFQKSNQNHPKAGILKLDAVDALHPVLVGTGCTASSFSRCGCSASTASTASSFSNPHQEVI